MGKANRNRKERKALTLAAGDCPPGAHALFALPFKIEPSAAADTKGAAELVNKFTDTVMELLAKEEFAAIDTCENGREAVLCLERAIPIHRKIARTRAAEQARRN